MSSLFKLSIKGIRAFEPEQEETIQFGFPLTLICGQNGCGKTTIIECLKYATTGDLPPNSKGGAFVNDPSLTGRTNVVGQVKLAFRNANGKSMITTRTVQLSRKKARGSVTNTFKTLEGQLVVIDKGNKVSISTKNAEMDSQTPIYLGASRAILDYVIFCHQDDSLWPLSEASVLKKRFDDIFEASKFTKVLDNLKVIKKDMITDIKLIEQSVSHLKIDKDRAKKIHDRLNLMSQNSDELNQEISSINLEIEKKERDADALFSLNQDFHAILSEFERLTHEKRARSEQAERLRGMIDLLDISDQELLEYQANFNKITDEKQLQVDELMLKCSELNQEKKRLSSEHSELVRLDGSYRAKETEYHQRQQEMTNLIGDSTTDYVSFGNELDSRVKQNEKELEDLKKSLESKHTKLQTEIQSVLDEITKQEQRQLHCDNDIAETTSKIQEIKEKLKKADSHETELDSQKGDLEALTTKFQEKKGLREIQSLETEIETDNSTLSKLEFEVDELSKKISTSNKQSELRTKQNLQSEALDQKNRQLNKLVDAIKVEYEKELGAFDLVSCSTKLEEALVEVKSTLNNQKSREKDLYSTKTSQESVVQMERKEVAKYEQLLTSLKSKITGVIEEDEISTYESVVEDLEESYRNVTEDINTFEVTRQFNLTAIKYANDEKLCLLCKRLFESPGLEKFLNELSSTANEGKLKSIEQQADEIKLELAALKNINVDVLTYRDTLKKLEQLNPQLKLDEDTLQAHKSDLDRLMSEISQTESRLQNLQTLQAKVLDIERQSSEVKALEKVLDEINEELQEFGTVSLSISELQKLQQTKNLEIKLLRMNIHEKSEAKQNVQRELSKLEGKIKDMQISISNLERSISDITNQRNNMKVLEEKLAQLNDTKSDISKLLARSEQEKEMKKKSYDEIVLVDRESLLAKQTALNSDQKLYSSYQQCALIITLFETETRAKLDENLDRLKKLKQTIENLDSEYEAFQQKIKGIEKSISEASKEQHNIVANLDYRSLLKEIEANENRMIELDIETAQAKRDEYQLNSKKLREEISTLRSDHDSKSGELKQVSDQIRKLREELTTEYSDVNKNYHQEWIKLQTNMLVSNDIQTYSKALDNAIMKFHSIKMEDINRILKELWAQTYKGSDIETIAIKSDVNVQAKGNRSYNYRVVMYKGGNELDMRGRCSAGQKVLTSILIRLALAECFGTNCGMIALDEPTTNLDQENAESLAEALNQIIEFRKSQRNFQLIVITHDENFLTHINGDRFTDVFYRVQRDEQQSSRIYSLPISKISED